MAWQLIYTSAPRLLEAGRSGFGTVARHRQISPLLVSAIERASQFARLPGHDTDRVIFCHRIMAAAGGRFHVLSCIRDAGADYTGRTNHLAHHLVAEEREVAALGRRGASAADVLLAMSWISTWDEAPRFLEGADEIALANFSAQAAGGWAQTTGDARNAWLLAAGEASRGAYLVHTPGTDLRALFAESLRLAPDRLWQVPFTTALQPSDETSDFRWIGIEADSTLRAQAESSGRPVLDLTRPDTLPAPEVPANALTIGIPRPTAVTAGTTATAPRSVAAVAPRAAAPIRKAVQSPPISKRMNRKWIVLGVAGLLAIAVGLGFLLPWMAKNRDTRASQAALRKKVADWHVFSPQTADSFLNVKSEKLSSADQLLDEIGRAVLAAKAANFDKMRDIKTGDEFKQMAAAFGIEVPSDLTAFADGIHTLHSLHAEIEKARAASEQAGFDACRKQRDAVEMFAKERQGQAAFSKAIDELRAALDRAEVDALLACLHPAGSPAEHLPPTIDLKWIRQRLDPAKLPANPNVKNVVSAARELSDAWDYVEAAPGDRVSDALRERLAKSRSAWPKWLAQKAEWKLDQARGGATADAAAHVEPRKLSTTPIYFILGKASLENFIIPELRAGLSFRLVPKPGANPMELNERTSDGAVVLCRTKVGDKDFHVDLKEQKILAQPAFNDVSEPFALIARDSGGNDVFQLWIVGTGRDPVFPKHKSGLRRTGDRIAIEPDDVPFDGLSKSALWLRIPGEPPEQLPVNAWTVDLAEVRRKVEDARRKWDAAANSEKDADKSAEAEFNALVGKLEIILSIDEPQSRQERADLAPKDAPLHVRCGGYAMAVARAPKLKGYEQLFGAGKALRDLDVKAPAPKMNAAILSVANAMRPIGFANDKERALYSPGLDVLGKMLTAVQSKSPQAKAQREKTAADLKARLAEKPAILGDRVPPGIYELGTKVDGTDVVLMQFEVIEK